MAVPAATREMKSPTVEASGTLAGAAHALSIGIVKNARRFNELKSWLRTSSTKASPQSLIRRFNGNCATTAPEESDTDVGEVPATPSGYVAANDDVVAPLVLDVELEPPPHAIRTEEVMTKNRWVESLIFYSL